MQADDEAAAKALHVGLEKMLPAGRKTLRPVLVTPSDTKTQKTGTEN
jgi:hypothetical protein